MPWIFAGASVATLSAVLLLRMTSPPAASAGPVPVAGGMTASTDISNMSPRERADRLFNRVMLSAEQGDTTQLRFFAPMAVQAYQLIGDLDADAHYHLGMIHLMNGEYAAAVAQADTILRGAPAHLLALALKVAIADRKNDTAARTRALRQFASGYDKEIASGKTEYAEHKEVLDRTRSQATPASSTKP